MTIEKAVETYKDMIGPITEAYQEQKKVLGEAVRQHLDPTIKQFFEDEDIDYTVKVRAYVPYFNDGEPCEYRVYVDEEVCDDETGEWISLYDKPWHSKLEELIYSIPKEILEDTFGSHTMFYLSKEGFRVDEYHDHD